MSPSQSRGEEEQEERRRKLQLSTQDLLKEAREKSRDWESHPAPEHVELAFKKVNGGRKVGVRPTEMFHFHTNLTKVSLGILCL